MLIGLSGHIKSGKSTAAALIRKFDPSFEERYFAYKLKFIAAYLTGQDQTLFETQEGKEGFLEDWGMTRRKMLQQLGTESLRDHFHHDVWIKALFADYKDNPQCGCPFPNWIISDTRFPNEANAIKERGGKILRINRPFSLLYPNEWNEFMKLFDETKIVGYLPTLKERGYEPNEKNFIKWLSIDNQDLYNKLNHPSEIGLDDYTEFDYIINNTGTELELQSEIQNFLTTL